MESVKKKSSAQKREAEKAEVSALPSTAASAAAAGGGGGVRGGETEVVVGREGADKKRKASSVGTFAPQLRQMMYGFGDDFNPLPETVDLVEDIVIEYITDMVLKAHEISKGGKLSTEDFLFQIRKDPRKFSRAKELLAKNLEVKKARAGFDEKELMK